MNYINDACSVTRINAAGTTVITSGFCNIVGVAFLGTATGDVQFFAGVTTAASLSPVISFSGTTSAVAGGFSPMFLRFPMAVSGSGLTVKLGSTGDANIMLFWLPVQTA